MQKIEDLRLETFSFEDEIASLQHELAAAGGRTLKLAVATHNTKRFRPQSSPF